MNDLTPIAGGDCGRDDCPTFYTTGSDEKVAIKGYPIESDPATGETTVEFPTELLKEAVRALGW